MTIKLKEACQLDPTISLTKYIELPHSQIWTVKYFTEATAHNTPLLVAHGGPGVTHHYLLPLQQIAQYRPVIFYDQGGCGTSALKGQPKWTVEFFLKELENLADALHLKSFHFLGHSWGGALGIEYALLHKSRLKSLVLASPLISGDLWTKDTQHVLAQMPIAVQDVLRYHEKAGTTSDPDYIKATKIYSQTYVCRMNPEPANLRYSLDHLNLEMYLSMFGPHRFEVKGTLASYDRFEDLKRITTVPALITCGRHDISVPETMQKCADQLPRGTLQVFENSAHFPHLEEEIGYIAVVEGFLREHE